MCSIVICCAMLMKRANKMFISLAAVLSLLVSALAACACSHHQPQVNTEPPSCHSSSHGTDTASEPSLRESFGAGCNCFVNSPSPAITAKSESKRSPDAKQHGLSAVAISLTGVGLRPLFSSIPDFGSNALFFQGRPRTAGPPRAPPRL